MVFFLASIAFWSNSLEICLDSSGLSRRRQTNTEISEITLKTYHHLQRHWNWYKHHFQNSLDCQAYSLISKNVSKSDTTSTSRINNKNYLDKKRSSMHIFRNYFFPQDICVSEKGDLETAWDPSCLPIEYVNQLVAQQSIITTMTVSRCQNNLLNYFDDSSQQIFQIACEKENRPLAKGNFLPK